jgi:hypothetical protein
MLVIAAFVLTAAQPAMDWLAPFVGVWETTDTYHPLQGEPIVERATRTCQMVMQGSYLQCESVATRPGGGGRTYWFLINYAPLRESHSSQTLRGPVRS